MEKLMESMRSMPGMGGMSMFNRDDIEDNLAEMGGEL